MHEIIWSPEHSTALPSTIIPKRKWDEEMTNNNNSLEFPPIITIGWYCWHEYTTNPGSIVVQVGESLKGELTTVGRVNGKLASGLQVPPYIA